MIFSNILVKDGKPYWLGMGKDLPEDGYNYYGKWKKGLKDKNGKEVSPAHRSLGMRNPCFDNLWKNIKKHSKPLATEKTDKFEHCWTMCVTRCTIF